MYFRAILLLPRQVLRRWVIVTASLAMILSLMFVSVNKWMPVLFSFFGAEFSKADVVLFGIRGQDVLFVALPILVIVFHMIIKSDETPLTVLLIGNRRAIWRITILKCLILSFVFSLVVMLLNIPVIKIFSITENCGWANENGLYFAAFNTVTNSYTLLKICLMAYLYLALMLLLYSVMLELLSWIINSDIIAIILVTAEILFEIWGIPLIMHYSRLYFEQLGENSNRWIIYLFPVALTTVFYTAGLFAAQRKEFLNDSGSK